MREFILTVIVGVSIYFIAKSLKSFSSEHCSYPNLLLYSDTVSRSAIFCGVATTIERCKTEGVVDVFQVVKAMRVQKPGAIQTVVCV